jgi:hypothetical protein
MRGTLLVAAAVASLALAVPASAEDTFVGARVGGVGVGVDVGHRHHYRTEGYDRYDRVYGAERCRTTIIRHSDGSVRKIKRCRD